MGLWQISIMKKFLGSLYLFHFHSLIDLYWRLAYDFIWLSVFSRIAKNIQILVIFSIQFCQIIRISWFRKYVWWDFAGWLKALILFGCMLIFKGHIVTEYTVRWLMLAKCIQWCIRSWIETARWVRWRKRIAYLCCFFCKNVWNTFLVWCQVVLVCGGIWNFLEYIFSRLIFGILVECILRISEDAVWLVCSRNFIMFIGRFSKWWSQCIRFWRMRAMYERIAWFL